MVKLLSLLKESLKEEIQKKDAIDSGRHKIVYPLSNAYKSRTNVSGNFVAKKWKATDVIDGIIKREYDIYLKNKDLFAPIDYIDFKRRIMIQKKLDTSKAKSELSNLRIYLKKFYENHYEYVYRDLPAYIEAIAESPEEEKKVRISIPDKDMVVFDKWLDFTKKLLDMDKSFIDRFGKARILVPDYHEGNIGYDSDGELKFIDI